LKKIVLIFILIIETKKLTHNTQKYFINILVNMNFTKNHLNF